MRARRVAARHSGYFCLSPRSRWRRPLRSLFPKTSGTAKAAYSFVDDEKDSLLMAKKVLESAGYSVLTAEDGAEAIKIYRNNSDTISVVIMDLIMPHVRGDEAAKEIRKDKG